MNHHQAKVLLEKYKQNTCTKEEQRLVEYWAHHLNENGDHGLSEDELNKASLQMWKNIDAQTKQVKPSRWLYPAAAAILVFAFAGLIFNIYYNNRTTTAANPQKWANHIKSGGNKAILTLANGNKIILDSVASGRVISDEGVIISKDSAGQVVYSVATAAVNKTDGQLAYNTISTPRGGQYQVILPDGSKVWLNAQSSLRFPLAFNNADRTVYLTGEGYFEVKHLNPVNGRKIKFIVNSRVKIPQSVEVLGTHFNINAYNDEDAVKTTLLEGSVSVSALGKSENINKAVVLKPGEQSIISPGNINVIRTDADEAVAWKNGYFRFNDESLESIMRKVERWYNVNVIYRDSSVKKVLFAGVTSRFANVAELLKMLELTGEVSFKIDGDNIVVQKNK